MKLSEAFSSPNSRVEGAWVFVDMFDSTGMKANGVDATWLPTTGWFYDVVTDVVSTGGVGTMVKYLGDGMMIAYGPDGATQAINDAIRIQEALDDGVEGRQVRISCSIGIATGEAVTFELPPGHNDYLGESIDKAARLCSAASPQAIFVDVATTASAQMNKVRSRVGEVLRRPIAEYQGDVQRASLTGFSAPVEYHEILWAQQLFGLKSKVLTATLDSVADRRADMPRPSGQTPLRGERGRRGVVTHLDTAKHHWFIKADDGEPFYTDARFVVSEDELQIGDVVYFLPRPSLVEGKARLAGAVVAVDQDVEGTVVSVLDGFAFVRIADSRGNMQDIFVSLGDCSFSVERHQHVEFTVGESDRGAKAEDLEPAVPRPRKAA